MSSFKWYVQSCDTLIYLCSTWQIIISPLLNKLKYITLSYLSTINKVHVNNLDDCPQHAICCIINIYVRGGHKRTWKQPQQPNCCSYAYSVATNCQTTTTTDIYLRTTPPHAQCHSLKFHAYVFIYIYSSHMPISH